MKGHSETAWIIMHDSGRDQGWGSSNWFWYFGLRRTRHDAWTAFLKDEPGNKRHWRRRGFRAVKVRVTVDG